MHAGHTSAAQPPAALFLPPDERRQMDARADLFQRPQTNRQLSLSALFVVQQMVLQAVGAASNL